ncbi:MAG: hypothetical protein EPO21_13160 [Chloroflexota bacterium]|nr:MAG: hypothetical protein EPO21_13160 [Chloroflexota bacterium]
MSVTESIANIADCIAESFKEPQEPAAPAGPTVEELLAEIAQGRALKGDPVRVFSAQQSNALSDKAVDFRNFNMAHVEMIVSGTTPSATISLEGGAEEGGNYLALPGSNISQTAVAANLAFDVPVGSAWLKVRIASISGTFGAGQGYTVIVTPYVGAGPEPMNVEIGGIAPQLDDTDKPAVSLYLKGTVAGDTPPEGQGWNLGNGQGNRMGVVSLATQWRYNGNSHDKVYNNYDVVALTSAARTGDAYSAELTNFNARGLILMIECTAVGAPAGNIDQLKIQFKTVSGAWQTVHAWGTIGLNAAGVKSFVIYPGAASTSSWSGSPVQSIVPRSFRIAVIHTNQADSITYSVNVGFII